METPAPRSSGPMRAMGQFIEEHIKKISDLSSVISPSALKKQLSKLNKYFFGKDYIFLDSDGTILSWNAGFEALQGYKEKEIVGQNLAMFYMPLERERQLPEKLMSQAAQQGQATQRGKWVRKDGSTFLGTLVLRAIRSHTTNELLGFSEEMYKLVDDYE